MADFRTQLLADFDRDLAAGAEAVFAEFVKTARADRATPKATGQLAAGIIADRPSVRPGLVSATVRSTRRSDRGADIGTILDRSTGRLVEARSYGRQAFGPISPPLSSGREFIRAFRVTTKHVGWWDTVTRVEHLRAASQQLAKFDL